MLELPTPKRLLTALKANRTGAARVTAAFSMGSLSIPTKKVSARLYSTMTRELITVGMARVAMALGMGVDSKSRVLSLGFKGETPLL